MKQITITIMTAALFMFAGILSSANAQSPVSFGIKGGMNISNFTGQDYDSDARSGLAVGAALDFSLPVLPFGIETGVYYSQKGAKSSEDGLTGTLKVDYIEVPLMAKFRLGPPGPITPHLVLGPYAGFNINSEAELSGDGGSISGDLSDDTNSTEFGGVAGVGIDFNLGLTKLNAQLRYSYGFTSVFEGDFDDGEKNAALSILVGIRF
jgi:hypothetical protein